MAATPFRDKAIDFYKIASLADSQRDYEHALQHYQTAIEHFLLDLKYEKNVQIQHTIQNKVEEILGRAEQIKQFIEKTPPQDQDHPPRNDEDHNLTEEEKQLRAGLEDVVIAENPNVHWEDIAGLEEAKDALKESVLYPLRMPQLFESRLEPWLGILLYGPPGTGKTQLAKAVATEVNSKFYSVSSADLVSKWVGQSERTIKQLFALARETKPSIIFIDEIDSLGTARSENENESSRRIKTEILTQLQGVGNNMDQVLVLAATNLPWNLDPGILRRFQRRIYIPLPDIVSRKGLVQIHLKGIPNSLTAEDRDELAEKTVGYSGSDMKVVVQDARYSAVRMLKTATHFLENPETGTLMPCSPGDPKGIEMIFEECLQNGDERLSKIELPPVSRNDLDKALTRCKPSVEESSIQQHDDWTEALGQRS